MTLPAPLAASAVEIGHRNAGVRPHRIAATQLVDPDCIAVVIKYAAIVKDRRGLASAEA